ncbi:MAG: hypothetical protein WBC33_03030 [Conexibacter sp.]
MTDVLQLLGAVLILIPFTAVQLGRMRPSAFAYLLPNLAGSLLLAALALADAQWGFLLLETVWGAVSLWGLLALARGRPVAGAH